jgi:putative phosphoribosyl transferase
LEGVVDPPAVVLGVARGGVVVAAPVAEALGAELDVVVPRKLRAPWNPELAIGAVAPGVRVVNDATVRAFGVTAEYVDAEVERQEREIERRLTAYRGGRAGAELTGRTAIVVDDGVATGATAVAALRWARAATARRVIFAAPVGPEGIEGLLRPECDRCVILETPSNLRSVGEWYITFDQVEDETVLAILAGAAA